MSDDENEVPTEDGYVLTLHDQGSFVRALPYRGTPNDKMILSAAISFARLSEIGAPSEATLQIGEDHTFFWRYGRYLLRGEPCKIAYFRGLPVAVPASPGTFVDYDDPWDESTNGIDD